MQRKLKIILVEVAMMFPNLEQLYIDDCRRSRNSYFENS